MYYGRVGECGTQALSGQRPATDVVCQPAKVNHKHNICLGYESALQLTGVGRERLLPISSFTF